MDKQIIKNIIIEKQIAIPNYKLVHRDFLFGDKSNYILVGIRRAGKSYLLYQDIQTRLNKGEQTKDAYPLKINWNNWNNWNAANRSKLIGTQPPRKSPFL